MGGESAKGQDQQMDRVCAVLFSPFPTCLALLYPNLKQPPQSAVPVPRSWEDVLTELWEEARMLAAGTSWLMNMHGWKG